MLQRTHRMETLVRTRQFAAVQCRLQQRFVPPWRAAVDREQFGVESDALVYQEGSFTLQGRASCSDSGS